MRALVLDTSTPAVSAGLVEVTGDDAVVLAEQVVVDARRHGELLAPGMREVLSAGAPDVVVVGVGPGPFTGLRVGIVTAAAFGEARGLPVLGVCSLDGLASPRSSSSWGPTPAGKPHNDEDRRREGDPGVGVVTDARRKEVYWAAYDASGEREEGPHVSSPQVAREALAGRTVVGDGALLYGFATADEPRYPQLARLAAVALERHRAGEPPLPLTPLYLRRPDATPQP